MGRNGPGRIRDDYRRSASSHKGGAIEQDSGGGVYAIKGQILLNRGIVLLYR